MIKIAIEINNMTGVVKDLLNETTAIWNTYPPMVSSQVIFLAKCTEFQSALDSAIINTKIITSDKVAKRKAIENFMHPIIVGLKLFAKANPTIELIYDYDISISGVRKLSGAAFKVLYDNVRTDCTDNLTGLATFNITQQMLTDLDALIGPYEAIFSKTQLQIDKGKLARQNLKDFIKSFRAFLPDDLDVAAEYFLTINPEFYDAYVSAREINDIGSHGGILRGVVAEAITGIGLKGINVKLQETGIISKTNHLGLFYFPKLDAGSYTLQISKKGYKDYIVWNIPVMEHKITVKNISLIKEKASISFPIGSTISVAAGATVNNPLSLLGGTPNPSFLLTATGAQMKVSMSLLTGVHDANLFKIINPGDPLNVSLLEMGQAGSTNMVITNMGTVAGTLKVQQGILELIP
ncbi:MAG: hypothetical protein A2X12_07400 [Bacteroidetes bacterium GWE2_29_8]|nr:MAG: hypothetical protein A2X12_07400 [Bacteroidetes bacterium GWE2_29_8]